MINSKIKTIDEAREELQDCKQMDKKIVFTNGCFDILHSGHVQYLEDAKTEGDILLVALNSDISVKSIKGPKRPINPQLDRMKVVAALESVDIVVCFDEDTPLEIIKVLLPDVLVKGGDWQVDDIVGSDVVIDNGGEVKSIAFRKGFSTTGLIDKIRQSNDETK